MGHKLRRREVLARRTFCLQTPPGTNSSQVSLASRAQLVDLERTRWSSPEMNTASHGINIEGLSFTTCGALLSEIS